MRGWGFVWGALELLQEGEGGCCWEGEEILDVGVLCCWIGRMMKGCVRFENVGG